MPPRRSPITVLAAWLVTGPPGHLWGGLADWLGLVRAWARARVRPHSRDATQDLSR